MIDWLFGCREKQQEYQRLMLGMLNVQIPELLQRMQRSLTGTLDPEFLGGLIGSNVKEMLMVRDMENDRLRLELATATEKWRFYSDQLQKDPGFRLSKLFDEQSEELKKAQSKMTDMQKRIDDCARVLEYERMNAQSQISQLSGKIEELNRIIAHQHHQLVQLIGDEYSEG